MAGRDIADLLEGRSASGQQGELGQGGRPAVLKPEQPQQWVEVDVRGLRVERVRDFGQIYLGLSLWRRLGLHTLLGAIIEPGKEEVAWELVGCILTVARFCSSARRQKEAAMIELARQRLRAQLDKTHARLQRAPARDPSKIERRIGRWLGRFPAAEKLIEVMVQKDEQGRACGLQILERAQSAAWAQRAHGAYLLRTNCTEEDPARLWRWYMQLTPAEEAFRISKSDLNLRPVFHQKTERVEAHILVCFLTLAFWRTLEMWMRGKHLGNCARQLVKEVATVRSMDLVLPVKEQLTQETRDLRLRVVARPDRMVAELLVRLGLDRPSAPKILQNVVEKNDR